MTIDADKLRALTDALKFLDVAAGEGLHFRHFGTALDAGDIYHDIAEAFGLDADPEEGVQPDIMAAAILAQADRIAVLEAALRRCGEIVEQNLYRQHEKVEDVPTIVARALGSDT